MIKFVNVLCLIFFYLRSRRPSTRVERWEKNGAQTTWHASNKEDEPLSGSLVKSLSSGFAAETVVSFLAEEVGLGFDLNRKITFRCMKRKGEWNRTFYFSSFFFGGNERREDFQICFWNFVFQQIWMETKKKENLRDSGKEFLGMKRWRKKNPCIEHPPPYLALGFKILHGVLELPANLAREASQIAEIALFTMARLVKKKTKRKMKSTLGFKRVTLIASGITILFILS